MERLFFANIKHFRYERKFYVEGLSAEQVEAILRLHPAMFGEIYHQRFVNNIYFDSFDMKHYFDNISGLNRRLKVRIRWYGDLMGRIDNPMLELKLKHNQHVAKLSYRLNPFILNNSLSIKMIRETFRASPLPAPLKLYLNELNFSFLNRYSRKYFLSANRHYRITTDIHMQAYKLSSLRNIFLHKITDHTNVIVELKYNKLQDTYADGITNYFPFRISKSSKYVLGFEGLRL